MMAIESNKKSKAKKLYKKILAYCCFCKKKRRSSHVKSNGSLHENVVSLNEKKSANLRENCPDNNIMEVLIKRHIDFLGNQAHLYQTSRTWFKAMIYIISDFLQAILSLLSCILYIISTYVDENSDKTFLKFIHTSDYVITALFTLDLMRHFFESKNKIRFLFKIHSIIDLLAILPIYLQIIFNFQQSALGFLHILQIFRIIRILRLYRLFKEYEVEGTDKIDNSLNEARFSLQKQIAVLICTIFALLFIAAGISYEMDGIFERTYLVSRVDANNQYVMFDDIYTFFYAFYLMFQTFFSLGYGDVFPSASSSRILICFLVLLFLFVTLDQALKLYEIKSKTSRWDHEFKHQDHTIILGMFNENTILKILQELFKFEQEQKIEHILLIRCLAPSVEFINLMESPIYEGKISYLQTYLLSEGMPIKANMKKCRNVFLVNESPSSFSYQQDKMIVTLMHSMQECFPFISKIARISSPELAKDFCGNLSLWNPWNKVFSTITFKNHLMVENIFNKGFSTMFSNFFGSNKLLSMQKDLPKINWYMEYGASLLQEIFCVKISKFFHGMNFNMVVQILSKTRSRLNAEGLVIIGIKTRFNEEEQDGRTTILINPQDYAVKNYDQGIVIATNQERAEFLTYFHMEAEDIQVASSFVNDDEIFSLKKFSIHREFELTNIAENEFAISKLLSNHILLWKEDISQKVSGQIILFYADNIFESVINLLRTKTKKPIFLYSDTQPTERWYRFADKTPNIYMVQGDVFDINHLRNSGIQKAFHVCIFNPMTISMTETNTPECPLLANLIDEYFNVPYTIEVNDQNEMKFLGNKPKKYIANLGFQFYPKYIAGDLYVLNVLDSLISFSSSNPTCLDIFIHMFIHNENRRSSNEFDGEIEWGGTQNENTNIYENLEIKTIKCPDLYKNKSYAELIFDFCNVKPSLIPIGLVTDKYTSLKKEKVSSIKKINHNVSVNYFQGNVFEEEIDQNLLSRPLTLTNPLPTTILNENDRIIVIGNMGNMKNVSDSGMSPDGKGNFKDGESVILEDFNEREREENSRKLLSLMDLTLSGKRKIIKKIEEKNIMIKNLMDEIERKKHGYGKLIKMEKL